MCDVAKCIEYKATAEQPPCPCAPCATASVFHAPHSSCTICNGMHSPCNPCCIHPHAPPCSRTWVGAHVHLSWYKLVCGAAAHGAATAPFVPPSFQLPLPAEPLGRKARRRNSHSACSTWAHARNCNIVTAIIPPPSWILQLHQFAFAKLQCSQWQHTHSFKQCEQCIVDSMLSLPNFSTTTPSSCIAQFDSPQSSN